MERKLDPKKLFKKRGFPIFIPRDKREIDYRKIDPGKVRRIVEATGCGVMAAINALAGVTYSPRLLSKI